VQVHHIRSRRTAPSRTVDLILSWPDDAARVVESRVSLRVEEQLGQREPQCLRHHAMVEHRDISFAPLDRADERAVKFALHGQFDLRHVQRRSPLANAVAQLLQESLLYKGHAREIADGPNIGRWGCGVPWTTPRVAILLPSRLATLCRGERRTSTVAPAGHRVHWRSGRCCRG